MACTVKTASLVAVGHAAASGAISAQVAALAEGVLKIMLVSKLKIAMAALVVCIMVGGGVLALCQPLLTAAKGEAQTPDAGKTGTVDPQKDRSKSDKKLDDKKAEKPMPEMEALQGTWVKISEEFGGKPVAKEDMRPQWWHFERDKLTMHGIDLRVSKPEKSDCTYSLAEDKKPKIIEMKAWRRQEGPRTKAPWTCFEGLITHWLDLFSCRGFGNHLMRENHQASFSG
jgi:uncharacterized protein (TIGR03067 family)